MVLADDSGYRTPSDASLVGVRPKHHCCLSPPVRLGLSVFVATIPFSYANHPVHRWTIARVRARVLLRPTLRARAGRVVCTHFPHFTFNVERLFSQNGLLMPCHPTITTSVLTPTTRVLASAALSHIALWLRAPHVRTAPSSREIFTRPHYIFCFITV